MQCPRCQQENPAHARFCLGCGARLALACSACGTELPGGARFCLQCGQAVVAGSAAAPPSPAPETYTPKHLAEKILTSKAALEDALAFVGRALTLARERGQFVEARGPEDIDRAFSEMTRARAGALTVITSSMLFGERRRLVDLAAKNRLPAMYTGRDFVDAGGSMSHGQNVADLFRHAAVYVDKILKGAKPAALPVEQPTKFELIINLKTAKALGLTIPPSLLARADQVIE